MHQLNVFVLAAACAGAALGQVPGVSVQRSGSLPAVAGPDQNFTGTVKVDSAFKTVAPGRASGGIVTFDPGARSAWHVHPLGQTLIVTAGNGWVQQWGKAPVAIGPGDVVSIAPGAKHWHGATLHTSMRHVAITEALDGKSTQWLEKVSDAQYPASAPAPKPGAVPDTPAARQARDTAPQLFAYTETVLFGDLWQRPDLAARDRSMVTMSALLANGQAAQMTSHMNLALNNGVKPEEIGALIAYVGAAADAPRALALMHEVLGKRGLAAPASASLGPRDRSLANIAASIAAGRIEQLEPQLAAGMGNGLSKNEVREIATHLAFYAGWPRAMSALPAMKNVFDSPKEQ